jgi:1-aminocyclopropane-1-carboxylate deaminase/D-cysteine desulfhydrase-like pyridoxal-dependent ACC family enzyme
MLGLAVRVEAALGVLDGVDELVCVSTNPGVLVEVSTICCCASSACTVIAIMVGCDSLDSGIGVAASGTTEQLLIQTPIMLIKNTANTSLHLESLGESDFMWKEAWYNGK